MIIVKSAGTAAITGLIIFVLACFIMNLQIHACVCQGFLSLFVNLSVSSNKRQRFQVHPS